MRLPGAHKRIVILITLMFVAIVLVLLGAARTVFVLAVNTNERNLGERLVTKGISLAAILEANYRELFQLVCPDDPNDSSLWTYYADSPIMEQLQATLVEFQQRSGVEGAQVICPSGWVLASTTEAMPPGVPSDLLAIDKAEIEQVLKEHRPQTTVSYQWRRERLKRAYIPVLNHTGEIIALVRLEASRLYFRELEEYRGQILLRGLVVLVLLLGLFLIFQRLLRAVLWAEERMAEAERFQAMGALAAGLAHELRNPLGIIRATTENLMEETPPDAVESRRLLSYIVDEIERLNQLIMQFLQLAKEDPPGSAGSPCDPVKTVEEVLNLMRKGFEKEHIRFSVNHNGPIPMVMIPEKALRQVILNLLINARDAVSKTPDARVELEFGLRRHGVTLEVRDNGPGIPPDMLKQIFHPFVTTKPSGAGLGLTISKNLMERHGGRLTIRNAEKGGCVATLVMPRAPES